MAAPSAARPDVDVEVEVDVDAALRMPRPGDRLGRYQLLAPLGQGGMAAVFVARGAPPEEGPFACKVMLPHLRSRPHARQMFLSEARTLGQLRHPGVVQVVEAGDERDEVPFLVMELLRGETLDALVQAHPRLAADDPSAVLGVLVQLAEALAFVHDARGLDGAPLSIVHRDVSPQNIHVGYDGVVKLLDFGIADFMARQRLTQTGEVRGKLGYLAPEQITRAAVVGKAADSWSLGVVARELLTGAPLFAGEDEASTLWNVTSSQVVPTAEVCPSLPVATACVLDACLERDPARRPSALEVARVLSAGLPASPASCVRSFVVRNLGEAQAAAEARLRAAFVAPLGAAAAAATVAAAAAATVAAAAAATVAAAAAATVAATGTAGVARSRWWPNVALGVIAAAGGTILWLASPWLQGSRRERVSPVAGPRTLEPASASAVHGAPPAPVSVGEPVRPDTVSPVDEVLPQQPPAPPRAAKLVRAPSRGKTSRSPGTEAANPDLMKNPYR